MEEKDKKDLAPSVGAEPVANANIKPEEDNNESLAGKEETVNSEITDGEGG